MFFRKLWESGAIGKSLKALRGCGELSSRYEQCSFGASFSIQPRKHALFFPRSVMFATSRAMFFRVVEQAVVKDKNLTSIPTTRLGIVGSQLNHILHTCTQLSSCLHGYFPHGLLSSDQWDPHGSVTRSLEQYTIAQSTARRWYGANISHHHRKMPARGQMCECCSVKKYILCVFVQECTYFISLTTRGETKNP